MHNILVLTDSRTHAEKEAIYPIIRHLAENPAIGNIFIADRANEENKPFFHDLNTSQNSLHISKVGTDYEYGKALDTQEIGFDQFDTISLRIDHPVEEPFLRYLSQHFFDKHIFNDPQGLITTASKEFLTDITDEMGDYMPPVRICHTVEDVNEFRKISPNVVLKKLRSFGGHEVYRYMDNGGDDNDKQTLSSDDDVRAVLEDSPVLAMEYLDPPQQSDNRLIVMDGQIIGAIKRNPPEGNWLCNASQGATTEITEPDERELEIVRRLNPAMKEHGIILYGVDTLLNSNGERVLSEANTLNAGGMYYLEQLTGEPLTKIVADGFVTAIEERQEMALRFGNSRQAQLRYEMK